MIDVARALPEDPDELRAFTQLLLAEVKSQAMLIESKRPVVTLPGCNSTASARLAC